MTAQDFKRERSNADMASDLRFCAPGRTRTCNLLFRRWLSLDAVLIREVAGR
jgi:hypothetical protein